VRGNRIVLKDNASSCRIGNLSGRRKNWREKDPEALTAQFVINGGRRKDFETGSRHASTGKSRCGGKGREIDAWGFQA